jgi:drug/metabolite transporter (DMT)-like permease
VAIVDLNAYAAHILRLGAAVLILAAVNGRTLGRLGRYGARSLGMIALAGMVGIGGSGLLYLSAVKYAGAARTASLAGTMPLFAALLSWLVLRERITPRLIVGSAVTVAGIWLIVG